MCGRGWLAMCVSWVDYVWRVNFVVKGKLFSGFRLLLILPYLCGLIVS